MVLGVRELRVFYNTRPAMEPFSLHLRAGQIVGLAGESGSGKSTILRAMAGLLPTGARQEGTCSTPLHVGYVPQDLLAALSPFLPIGQQLPAGAVPLLNRLGLSHPRIQAAYPHQLSGGERQRVLIAVALAGKPALLLADEPAANLDAASQGQVVQLLLEAAVQHGTAVLVASHREQVFRDLRCPVHRLTPLPPAGAEPLPALLASTPLLDVQRLNKTYFRRDWLLRRVATVRALQDVSLRLGTGESVVLAGPSGAGKSTLAHCIAGRENCDSGSIRFHGSPRHLQLLQQEPSESLNPRLSIADSFRESCGHAAPALLEAVELPASWLERKTADLSEGQRARVALARTLEAMPQGLLILDESLSGLDPATRRHILRLLVNAQRTRPLSFLVISHDPEIAGELGARTVRMEEGCVVA